MPTIDVASVPVGTSIEALNAQHRALVLEAFNEDVAWAIGTILRDEAARIAAPVAIEVRPFHRPMFFAALPGSTLDNIEWLRRKRNVVERYHESSYAVGLRMCEKGTSLAERYGLPVADFAEHGGSFPIRTRQSGIVGVAGVSGLPQKDDHELVVAALSAYLTRTPVL